MEAWHNFMAQAHSWVVSHVFPESALIQLLLVLAAWLAAVLISRLLIFPWLEAKMDLTAARSAGKPGAVLARRLAAPLIALFLLWLAEGSARHFGWPQEWLRRALILLLAWVLSRGLITVFFDFHRQTGNRALGVLITLLIWGVAVFAISDLLRPVLSLLDHIDLRLGNFRLSLLHMMAATLISLVFLGLGRAASLAFAAWITATPGISPSFQALSIKLFKVGFYTLAIILTLGGLGIDLTNLAWLSGALGLGLGFGLQKVISNLASGFIILADKSIKPGDVIQVGDTYGWVNNLKSLYISAITRDGVEYLIPNEEIIAGKVINWSYSHNLVRVKIPVGVAYGSDLELVMKLMLEAAAAAARVLAAPKPTCRLMNFGDSAVNFQLRVWINDPQEGLSGVKSAVLLEVWKRFQEHGIEIPFPQRVLHHQSIPEIKIENLPTGTKPK